MRLKMCLYKIQWFDSKSILTIPSSLEEFNEVNFYKNYQILKKNTPSWQKLRERRFSFSSTAEYFINEVKNIDNVIIGSIILGKKKYEKKFNKNSDFEKEFIDFSLKKNREKLEYSYFYFVINNNNLIIGSIKKDLNSFTNVLRFCFRECLRSSKDWDKENAPYMRIQIRDFFYDFKTYSCKEKDICVKKIEGKLDYRVANYSRKFIRSLEYTQPSNEVEDIELSASKLFILNKKNDNPLEKLYSKYIEPNQKKFEEKKIKYYKVDAIIEYEDKTNETLKISKKFNNRLECVNGSLCIRQTVEIHGEENLLEIKNVMLEFLKEWTGE